MITASFIQFICILCTERHIPHCAEKAERNKYKAFNVSKKNDESAGASDRMKKRVCI